MTLQESFAELNEALLDCAYQAGKALGLIYLVRKMPFLELRQWVKDRMEKEANAAS